MPIYRGQMFVKWVFENQHKFQAVRKCSSSLRYKEVEESATQTQPEHVAPPADATSPAPDTHPQITPEISFKYDDLQVTLAAPYQLQPKPDVSDLGFGKYFTDHMLRIHYHKDLGGWQKPEITPFENLNLHPAAKALHYAVQVIFHK